MQFQSVFNMQKSINFQFQSMFKIVSDEWILTASHCVDGTNPAEIQVITQHFATGCPKKKSTINNNNNNNNNNNDDDNDHNDYKN